MENELIELTEANRVLVKGCMDLQNKLDSVVADKRKLVERKKKVVAEINRHAPDIPRRLVRQNRRVDKEFDRKEKKFQQLLRRAEETDRQAQAILLRCGLKLEDVEEMIKRAEQREKDASRN